jgi:hypothetical protein
VQLEESEGMHRKDMIGEERIFGGGDLKKVGKDNLGLFFEVRDC